MLCRRLSADRTDTFDIALDIRFRTSVDILPRWSPVTKKGRMIYMLVYNRHKDSNVYKKEQQFSFLIQTSIQK